MRTRKTATVLAALVTAATVSTISAPAVTAAQGQLRASVTMDVFKTDHRSGAVTYDTELVPAGSLALVTSVSSDSIGTTTELQVMGLVPDREYGAHVHVNPCGRSGDDAGPHYQHKLDPNQPSTDPAYANPENEIWLDFTTDGKGAASVRSKVDWTFHDDRKPASVVIHERHTSTGEGEAGTAGARLACITVSS